MQAGKLDRRIQFLRAAQVDDGLTISEVWAVHGSPIWASRQDVSDGEKARSGMTMATVMARFTVRSSLFTRSITARDRLTEGGRTFEIVGIKEIGRRDGLEITAVGRTDQ